VRHLLLGVLLFAAYAATAGFAAAPGAEHGEQETRHLLIAESLVSDGDLDLRDEFASNLPVELAGEVVEPHGAPNARGLHEPHGPGFGALIAPAYALAGPDGAALLCAALAALAFVAALPAARTVVPDPWATRGVLLVALSPPAVAHATAIDPGWAAAALLGVAILLTVRVRDDAQLPAVAGAALALALLPWLDATVALAGLPVVALLLHWTFRQHRRLAALIAVELLSTSLIAYAALSEVVYGGLTPLAAALPGQAPLGADSPAAYVERLPRLVSLWLDRDSGLLRWAPVLALALHGTWLLWRSRRDRIARALPARRDAEAVAGLSAGVGLMVLMIAVIPVRVPAGGWLAGGWALAALPSAAVLVAWSLRRVPRTGALLGLLGVGTSAWLSVQLARGALPGWVAASESRAPWGPLELLLPTWNGGTGYHAPVTVAVAVGVLVLLVAERRAGERGRLADSPQRL